MRYFNQPNYGRGGESSARQRRSWSELGGFTLVELLVVMSIICILLAMLLPALQAARNGTANNVLEQHVQLGLAIHDYEFHFEAFPPGVTNPDGPIRNEAQGIHVGWIVKILPYLDERAAFQKFDQAAGAYAPANSEALSASIHVLRCPSASEMGGPDNDVQRSSYAGCHHDAEAPIDEDNHGLLFLNSSVRYFDIFDGSSETILLGEVLVHQDSLGWASGTRATLRNTGSFESGGLPGTKPQETGEGPLHVGGFGSLHLGDLSNFAFADGSVRGISRDIDAKVFRLLGHRADGEIIKAPY